MPPLTSTLARRGLFAAVAFGLVVAATGVTHALTSDDSPRIIGGQVVKENPGGLAALIYEYEKEGQTGLQAELCTGSVVAPQWILTAEHCTDPKILKNFWRLSVRVNSAHAYSGGDRIAVDGWAVPPPRTAGSQSPGADMRLYHLAKPIPNPKILNISDTEPAVGTMTTMIGWGAVSASEQAGQDLLKTAQGRVISLNQTDAKGHPAIQTQGVDGGIWKGDSGGPLLVNNQIVGVASTAVPAPMSPNEKFGTQKYGNAVTMKTWITSVISTNTIPTLPPAPEKPSPAPGQPTASPTTTASPSTTTSSVPPAPTLPPAPTTTVPPSAWPTPPSTTPAPPTATVPPTSAPTSVPTSTVVPTAPGIPTITAVPTATVVPTRPPLPTGNPKPTAPRPPSPPAPWPTNPSRPTQPGQPQPGQPWPSLPPRPTQPKPPGWPGQPGMPGRPYTVEGILASPMVF